MIPRRFWTVLRARITPAAKPNRLRARTNAHVCDRMWLVRPKCTAHAMGLGGVKGKSVPPPHSACGSKYLRSSETSSPGADRRLPRTDDGFSAIVPFCWGFRRITIPFDRRLRSTALTYAYNNVNDIVATLWRRGEGFRCFITIYTFICMRSLYRYVCSRYTAVVCIVSYLSLNVIVFIVMAHVCLTASATRWRNTLRLVHTRLFFYSFNVKRCFSHATPCAFASRRIQTYDMTITCCNVLQPYVVQVSEFFHMKNESVNTAKTASAYDYGAL